MQNPMTDESDIFPNCGDRPKSPPPPVATDLISRLRPIVEWAIEQTESEVDWEYSHTEAQKSISKSLEEYRSLLREIVERVNSRESLSAQLEDTQNIAERRGQRLTEMSFAAAAEVARLRNVVRELRINDFERVCRGMTPQAMADYVAETKRLCGE